MQLTKHLPAVWLSDSIESLWYTNGQAGAHLLLLPDGRPRLLIPLGDGAPAPMVKCQSTQFEIVPQWPGATLGVTFKANGLRHFCADALDEVGLDQVVPCSTLWPWLGDSWVEPLQQAPTPTLMFLRLEDVLRRLLRAPQAHAERIQRAVSLLSSPFRPHSVADVADQVGLPPRQFLQAFRHDTGLTPKAFARVMRFRAAAALMRRREASRWTEAAALCHYFDQAHMVREFRQFAGMTPSDYLLHPGNHATCLTLPPTQGQANAAAI